MLLKPLFLPEASYYFLLVVYESSYAHEHSTRVVITTTEMTSQTSPPFSRKCATFCQYFTWWRLLRMQLISRVCESEILSAL